jgi:hypothetical protein
MPIASTSGIVSISIDTAATSKNSTASVEAVDSVVIELFDRFQKQRISTTWILGDPKRHLLADRIVRGGIHEVAYGGEAISQLLECQRAGIEISTVSENPGWQQRDVDLLAKHGISVICRPEMARFSQSSIQPIRYGLWAVSVNAMLPSGGWAPYFTQLRRLRAAVGQSLRQPGICHLRIDAASIARSDVASGLRAVERLLEHLKSLEQSRTISVVTLCETAVHLQPKRSLPAARSILRAA